THDFIYHKGSYYLVMEYVNGMDLKTILSIFAPVPPLIAAIITREIARGLEHSHARGYIHRDVKPGNVLISTEGEVKIIDFGVAKEDTPNNITETGVIVGTPIYMSPEQVNGDDISNQTDIYSLGILFYEMLTGVKPYTALSNTELFSLISQGKYKSARSYVNTIPRKLNRILKKMLTRSLEKRYQSVSELIFDINQFLKWENQINLKYRLSRFMSNVNHLASQDTKAQHDDFPDGYQNSFSKRFWTFTLVFMSLVFMALGSYFSYQKYSERYLGNIRFDLNVPNAEIIKDNEKKYQSESGEITIRRLRAGTHLFRINAGPKYNTFEGAYHITANETREVEIQLQKQQHRAAISVMTNPTDANILINGKYLGKSPIKQKTVKVGVNKIELGLPGYEKWEDHKKLDVNENLRLYVELNKKKEQ
ncbi:protein kinase, partial [candidate division KSB1 bacterium]|nr:protein kinase [candidate division KSB1 bacterium]